MEALIVIIILGFIIYSIYLFIKMNIKTRSLNKKLNKIEEEIITKRNDLNNIEESTEALKNELHSTKEELKEVLSLKGKKDELETKILELNTKIDKLEKDLDDKTNQYLDLENEISEIQDSIVLFSPTAHLIDLGFYEEPKYLYETSERYKTEIQLVREKLKTLITNNEAIDIPNNIIAIEDNSLSKKILSGQAKLMLKTFNIETDLLLLNLKVSNFAKTMERIEKIATDIEKSAISLKCGFNEEYIKLKLEECQLQYQFKLKQAAEQEEQKAIREQMAEEQKAIRDFERAIAKAQKDEQMYQDALELAKKQLQIADDKEKELLNMKIANLEAKLQDTIENEKRAKSMAEQTKRGYVYVISNIGSFGEDIYKIGMTRRLEPLDRVKELGDASVPFFFDVHALIFSEDAPKLEKELHRVFDNQRVNMINQRREFFNVTLEEIKKEVEKNHGEIEFTMIAQADEYRETLNIKNSMAS